jgi:hypothetical protein
VSKLSEQVKGMDFRFTVEIHDILSGEWLEYAKFKEEGAAKDFINYQLVKDIATHGEPTLNLGKIWRIIER